jgi:RNA polymerase sigma-70 factor (ECF subfamily)
MDERALIARMQAGDFEAFTELVDAHKDKIYALVHRLVGNKENAEDIIQETFLKAIDNIGQFRGESSFGTWIYAIALNLSRAYYAKQKQMDLLPIDDYLPKSEAAHRGQSPLLDWQDPHRVLETRELRETVNKALESLPYKYREAFLLRYYNELSVKEVARLIGESEAATKSRILRARLAMREYLSTRMDGRYGG